ncbi:MAG: mannonate dehydratase [Oscillospiraceae bacterium]|nr:mannonate dehydratase [Oscillospiraceae bacterium]
MAWDYKFTMSVPSHFDDEDMEYVTQLGLRYVYTSISGEDYSHKSLKERFERAASHGVTISHMMGFTKPYDVYLNLPTKDETMKKMEEYLHIIASFGIKTHTMTWEPDQVWSTNNQALVRGARTRFTDINELATRPLSHGRVYTREEMWDNLAYFMNKMMPVYEKLGITLTLHPNDPPTNVDLGGCPCLIRGLDDYKKAFDIAGSKNLGMEFCCGCWLEGVTENMGDVVEDMSWCLENDRIRIVHFRNIDQPMPVFTEVYLDMGYYDMYKIMRTLCKYNFDGVITLDHSPLMVDGPKRRVPMAYAIGYMRALAERAIAEIN